MKLKNNKGFTLIELVLVLAILAILAVAALPNFFAVTMTSARTHSMEAVVGSVRSGLALYAANEIAQGNPESYPTLLDATAHSGTTLASPTAIMFDNVLQNGVTSGWFFLDADCYAYDTNGNEAFNEGTDDEHQYTTAVGTFLDVANCN